MDDAMLVRAALAGDHEAYGQLVDLHRRGIVGLSYRATESVSEAEILAHDAFVEAYLKLEQLRDPGRFGPWVRSIAVNLARAWLREQSRWSTMPDESEIETEAPQDEEDDPDYAHVGAGLARLSPRHRLVIGLHYVEGLSYWQISRLLEVPPGTVMSRLHRARTALREEVRRLRDDDVAQVGAEPFVRRVEAEIAALAATFGKDRAGATRLSVLLGASPARLGDVLHATRGNSAARGALARAVVLAGSPAIDEALRLATGAGALTEEGRETVRLAITGGVRLAHTRTWNALPGIASLAAYPLLDRLLVTVRPPDVVADLLLQLMDACADIDTANLISEALLTLGRPGREAVLRWYSDCDDVAAASARLITFCRIGTRALTLAASDLLSDDSTVMQRGVTALDVLSRLSEAHSGRARQAGVTEGLPASPPPRWLVDAPLSEVPVWAALGAEEVRRAVAALTKVAREGGKATALPAIHALGRLGNSEEREALWGLLSAGEGVPRAQILNALAREGALELTERFAALAADGDESVRRAAVQGLARIRDSRSVPVLRALAQDPTEAVGREALKAMHQMGADSSKPTWPRGYAAHPPSLARPEWKAHHISVDAALRALPELRAYEERELTDLVARVCSDWCGTRRMMTEHRLMRRSGGTYEFTPLGEAAWRLEHHIMRAYGG